MQRRDDAEPAIGQRLVRDRREVERHRRDAELDGQEQDDDGDEGDRGDDEVEGQRRQHAAIVEPGEEHDRQDDERLLVKPGMALHAGHGVEQEADGDGVGGLEHGVGHDEEQADIEGHQRADDVLGLRILAAGRGDRRGHLRIDHGDAGVEQARRPSRRPGRRSCRLCRPRSSSPCIRRPARCRRRAPRHGRGRARAAAAGAGSAPAGRCGCDGSLRPPQSSCRSAVSSSSPSREEVSSSLS